MCSDAYSNFGNLENAAVLCTRGNNVNVCSVSNYRAEKKYFYVVARNFCLALLGYCLAKHTKTFFTSASVSCVNFPSLHVTLIQGDSGGPLMAVNNEVWELYGATSFSALLCWAGAPAGFADVRGLSCLK